MPFKTKEERKVYDKIYYEQNKERIIERKRQHRLDNAEQYKERDKERYIKNPEYGKNYYWTNKERLQKNFKEWYKENTDYKQNWRKNNPEKNRLYDLKNKKSRKDWGTLPINEYFNDSHFHHLHISNHFIGIYIPIKLHQSVNHKYNDEKSMNKINKLAIEWFYEESIMENKINFEMGDY